MAGAIIDVQSVHWNTPPEIYEPIAEFFHGIDLDPCSNSTSKVPARFKFSLPSYDGLKLPWAWKSRSGTVCRSFWNPPFGEGEQACVEGCKKEKCKKRGFHCEVTIPGIRHWIAKANNEYVLNKAISIGLIPATVETKPWQQIIFKHAKGICWLKKRIKFIGADSTIPKPCALVLFGGNIDSYNFKQFFQDRLGPCYDPSRQHPAYNGIYAIEPELF